MFPKRRPHGHFLGHVVWNSQSLASNIVILHAVCVCTLVTTSSIGRTNDVLHTVVAKLYWCYPFHSQRSHYFTTDSNTIIYSQRNYMTSRSRDTLGRGAITSFKFVLWKPENYQRLGILYYIKSRQSLNPNPNPKSWVWRRIVHGRRNVLGSVRN